MQLLGDRAYWTTTIKSVCIDIILLHKAMRVCYNTYPTKTWPSNM